MSTHNNTLTNEAICEAIGWEYIRKASNFGNGLAAWKGEGTIHPQFTPDFHNSLDAQEKWLWPWLNKKGWAVETSTYPEFAFVALFNENVEKFYEAKTECPKQAFIKAFTQLIQGEI